MGSHSLGVRCLPPRPKAQPLLLRPHSHILWHWDPPAVWQSHEMGPWSCTCCPTGREPGLHPNIPPRSSSVGEELERGFLLQLGSSHKLYVSDVHPETWGQEKVRRMRVWSCCIIAGLINWKGDTCISLSLTPPMLLVLEKYCTKNKKNKLRSSISCLFSDCYDRQNKGFLLLFVCGFGVFLLK